MSLFIASDHAGFDLKEKILNFLREHGLTPVDLGCADTASVDYPDYANALANAMQGDASAKGILICGSGIGISIAANRHSHIRAALCHSVTDARLCRNHNDANVIVLGARTLGEQIAIDSVDMFLQAPFEGGRHQRRVDKLS